MLTTMIVLKK